MPGMMARLLVEVVQERIANIVLATSTLSEGINLPVATVLLPTVKRGQNALSAREFGNLIGRAGRPGASTEGRTLVLMRTGSSDWSDRDARYAYSTLIKDLTSSAATGSSHIPHSPLAA